MTAKPNKTSKKGPREAAITAVSRRSKAGVVGSVDERFAEIVALIEAARRRVFQAVNTELVEHYWQLGEYISRKLRVRARAHHVADAGG